MANEYYATTGSPATSSQGASATMRSEFTSVAAGFDKLPALSGNGSKLVQINSGGTAMAAIALTVGALLFGGAAGVLGQDGTNLFWDNTAKRLGIGNATPTVALDVTGAGKFSTGLTVSAGGITATGNSTITGTLGGVTTLTASTSVVTPAVTSAGALLLSSSVGALQFSSATGVVSTNSDFTHTFGDSTHRWISVFAGSVDTGSTASLLLRTNNTLTQAKIVNAGDGTNFANIQGGASPFSPVIFSNGGDTNIGLIFGSKGSGSIDFTTAGTFSGDINSGRTTQFQVIHTASATSNARITGAAVAGTVGATLSTSDGRSLAITPSVVISGTLTAATFEPQFVSSETAIGAPSTNTTVAHGLGTVPRYFFVVIRNKTAELGFSVGDEVILSDNNSVGSYVQSTYADATNIGIIVSGTPAVVRKDTFTGTPITVANWKYVIRAFK